MTAKEAREKRVCRVCEQPIDLSDTPKDAPLEFGRLVFPQRITFNFGDEFAHTTCVEKELKDSAKEGFDTAFTDKEKYPKDQQ